MKSNLAILVSQKLQFCPFKTEILDISGIFALANVKFLSEIKIHSLQKAKITVF